MATKTTKEKAPVEPPITPSEAHEEPLTEVKVAAAAGEAESSESKPLTEVKVVPLTEVKEKADEAAGKARLNNSEPPTEAKEEASEETPTAPVYDYEVLPPSRAGATEEQIAMAKRVLDQNADIPAVYIVGGLFLSEEWRADELTRSGERKVTVRRITKEKGS